MIKLINPQETVLGAIPLFSEQTRGEALQFNEKIGRVAYKSEEKITNDSAPAFVKKMVKNRHMSVAEFSNIVVSTETSPLMWNPNSNYLTLIDNMDGRDWMGGSIRAWAEELNHYDIDTLLDRIKKEFGPVADYDFQIHSDNNTIPVDLIRFCVHFINDRAFTHELVRHRVMSFLQESQRYVKYDTGIEIIKPAWYDESKMVGVDPETGEGVDESNHTEAIFYTINDIASQAYAKLRELEMHQQHARGVLTNATKTEIYVAGDHDGWKHLYDLRTGAGAHPDMKASMARLINDFQFKKFIEGYSG